MIQCSFCIQQNAPKLGNNRYATISNCSSFFATGASISIWFNIVTVEQRTLNVTPSQFVGCWFSCSHFNNLKIVNFSLSTADTVVSYQIQPKAQTQFMYQPSC